MGKSNTPTAYKVGKVAATILVVTLSLCTAATIIMAPFYMLAHW